jgi:transposase
MKVEVKGLQRLGMDEIALRKGQGHYVVVLVDLDRRQLIGMVKSRKHKDIQEVLSEWGTEVLVQVQEVSIDLSGNYRGLIQKVMPNAVIVADRFHVMQLISRELNSARNQVIKASATELDKAEKDHIQSSLKLSKYALLKPEESLSETQKLKLEAVKQVSPLLAQMHQQKETLRAIFEQTQTAMDAVFEISDWLEDAKETFPKSVKTIENWLEEITSYFFNRTTSGVVEGINNKLKLIKRLGYGFRNFENFKLRCLMCWHFDFDSA